MGSVSKTRNSRKDLTLPLLHEVIDESPFFKVLQSLPPPPLPLTFFFAKGACPWFGLGWHFPFSQRLSIWKEVTDSVKCVQNGCLYRRFGTFKPSCWSKGTSLRYKILNARSCLCTLPWSYSRLTILALNSCERLRRRKWQDSNYLRAYFCC